MNEIKGKHTHEIMTNFNFGANLINGVITFNHESRQDLKGFEFEQY